MAMSANPLSIFSQTSNDDVISTTMPVACLKVSIRCCMIPDQPGVTTVARRIYRTTCTSEAVPSSMRAELRSDYHTECNLMLGLAKI